MKIRVARIAREAVQIASLAFFIYLVTRLVYPLEWQAAALQWLSRLDPWTLFGQLRWSGAIPAWIWLPALTALVSLLFGRIFCGWLCPFGAFMMLADKLGGLFFKVKALRKFRRHRTALAKKLQPYRHFWLVFLIAALLAGSGLATVLTPFALFSHELIRLFRGLAPWALIAICVLTFFSSRLWCGYLCPTGLLLSFVGKWRLFRYQTAGNCTRCRKCEQACPVGAAPYQSAGTATSESSGAEAEQSAIADASCLVCGTCKDVCPTAAVRYVRRSAAHPESRVHMNEKAHYTRRQFLQIAGVFVAGILVTAVGRTARVAAKAAKATKILRPPGALDEPRFLEVCNRCGRCVKVCPNNALLPMPITEGIASFETPQIIPRKMNCSLCMVCPDVCPTGAIAKVPVEQVKMGTSELDQTRCLAWVQGKDCFVCGETCPILAIEIDDQKRPVLTDRCVGCGTCEKNCPVEGAAAIRVMPK